MINLSDELKRVFLAGVGAVAITAEKSKEVIDELVKKGELTIEQGKVLNEELKRNMKEKAEEIREGIASKEASLLETYLLNKLDQLSPEQIQAVKEKIAALEKQKENDVEE